ncbi:uncharacterized protein LOC129573007 [Sitodiplosis mosellana]|uniref:uncharacterized protein LOC129573007 n=1 Tax=Sitodiplosis mosellana TaxID=263140 RepID=UPI00244537F8|nr:uncharacterized protein LOC129573007 [Sitodiplosis mosellana]
MVYFVVFLRELRKNVVLPATWIKDIDKHYEKFMNNSLNSAQQHLCFYNSNAEAQIDGRPDENVVPDFNSEHCFHGKLKHYHVRYEDAVEFMNHLRHVEPAVYNQRRLNELPIPDLESQLTETTDFTDTLNTSYDSAADENAESVDSSGNDQSLVSSLEEIINDPNQELEVSDVNDGEITNSTDPLAVTVHQNCQASSEVQSVSTQIVATSSNTDESGSLNATVQNNEPNQSNDIRIVAVESLVDSASNKNGMDNEQQPSDTVVTEGTIDSENDAQNLELDSLATGSIDRKSNVVPLFNVHDANNDEIDQLLEEPEEIVYEDDVVIMVGRHGLPKPMAATEDDMIKRENDQMTGNIPFNETGNGRIYKIGGKLIEIPKKAVEKIIEWNVGPRRDDTQYDRKVCHSLLLSLVAKEQLQAVDAAVMEFIKDCFIIRCSGSGVNFEDRVGRIDVYKDELSIKLCGKNCDASTLKK